jgi:hypothetical protein
MDLLSIVKGHAFSIKKVLPALVAGFSCEDLAVRNGDAAIAQFARMARTGIAADEATVARRQLLPYCEPDTPAMVRLHEVLLNLARRGAGLA